jgi:prolyl 4-hydroxylase
MYIRQEIYDHQGRAHNVSIHPGDMLLFESHSIVHGHPFPLKGRFHAMIFLHFEPTGHSLERNESGHFYRRDEGKKGRNKKGKKELDQHYRENAKAGFGGQSSSASGLPPYLKPESPEEELWKAMHPDGWQPVSEVCCARDCSFLLTLTF